jgi:hypothetical protein
MVPRGTGKRLRKEPGQGRSELVDRAPLAARRQKEILPVRLALEIAAPSSGLRRRVRVLDLDHHLLAARQARAMHLADGGGRDWLGVERDGVAADQGWPLYLQRFADLVASEID